VFRPPGGAVGTWAAREDLACDFLQGGDGRSWRNRCRAGEIDLVASTAGARFVEASLRRARRVGSESVTPRRQVRVARHSVAVERHVCFDVGIDFRTTRT
jgi:Holliday junction resolvase-like predicted endonuclease